MSQDIADFLRARYAEQRQWEMSKRRMLPEAPPNTLVHEAFGDEYVLIGDDDAPSQPRMTVEEFSAQYTEPAPDPFVLADLDAKERIVKEWADGHADADAAACPDEWTGGIDKLGGFVLPVLALPYADHTDYREEWRPWT